MMTMALMQLDCGLELYLGNLGARTIYICTSADLCPFSCSDSPAYALP